MSIKTSTLISLSLFLACACTSPSGPEKIVGNPATPETEVQPKTETLKTTGFDSDLEAEQFLRNYGKEHPERDIVIETQLGSIHIQLFENTPLHRANMIFLIKEHQYFDDTWFHRVSPGHVVQGGNNDELSLQRLRKKIGNYKIKPESIHSNYHTYGSVAMARSYKKNPDKKSDPFEFYINLGQRYSKGQLDAIQKEYDIRLNSDQRSLYQEQGGSPHLDQEHTVIGQVLSGMEVIEAISKVETDRGEWPLTNIPLKISIKK